MKNQNKRSHNREVNPRKKRELAELTKNVNQYNSFLITSIDEMPALLLQRIRKELRNKAVIKTTKRRVLVKLFEEQAKKDEKFSKIADFCRGLKDSCAIIFSNEDIFSIVKVLQEKQERKKARPGVAKEDIVIQPGNTGMMAGPILAELVDSGIKAGLEKGKIVIKEKYELKKGQIISESLANVLEKLNILPITAKLRPLLAYDKKSGILFNAENLEINIEQQLKNLKQAYKNAFTLILNAKYFTKDSTPIFLKQAYNNAFHLTKEANIITKDNVKDFLIKAYMQASIINKKI